MIQQKMVPIALIEPNTGQIEGVPARLAIMKITFLSPEQMQKAENEIQELLDRKYKGASYTVSTGDY